MTRGRAILIALAAALLAFVIGFGWQYVRAERLNAALVESQRALAFQEIAVILGAATVEAQAGGHEEARRLASEAFTRLQGVAAQLPPAVLPEAQTILAQRDEVITLLSRAEPASGTVLAELFERYRMAWGTEEVEP